MHTPPPSSFKTSGSDTERDPRANTLRASPRVGAVARKTVPQYCAHRTEASRFIDTPNVGGIQLKAIRKIEKVTKESFPNEVSRSNLILESDITRPIQSNTRNPSRS